MARRPAPVTSWVSEGVADQTVKDKPGILYAINLSWQTGITAGNRFVLLDGGASGRKVFEFVFNATTGNFAAKLPDVGIPFTTDLYINFQGPSNDDGVVVNLGYD